jgi:hypothetical protein
VSLAAGTNLTTTGCRRRLDNPLLRHDFAITLTLLKDLFQQGRDAILVAGFVIFGFAFLRSSLIDLSEQTQNLAALAFSSAVAMFCDLFLRRRVRYFRHDSPLVPAALTGVNSLAYRVTWHAMLSAVATLVFCPPAFRIYVEFWMTWWFSLVPVAIAVAIGVTCNRAGLMRHLGWATSAWYSRRAGGGSGWSLTFGGLIIVVGSYLVSKEASLFLSAGVTLFIVYWYSPVDYGTVNFERISGIRTSKSVWAVIHTPIKFVAIFSVLVWIWNGLHGALLIMAIATAMLLYRFLEIALSRILQPRQVSFAMFALLGLTLSITIPIPFMAPLPIIVVLIWIKRHATKRMWLLP